MRHPAVILSFGEGVLDLTIKTGLRDLRPQRPTGPRDVYPNGQLAPGVSHPPGHFFLDRREKILTDRCGVWFPSRNVG